MSGAAADGIDDRDIPKQEFLDAAFNGDIDKIDGLLRDKKVHIDSVDDDQVTALHIAAAMGNNKLVVRLLDYGANIHAVNHLGMTAYHYAAREGKLAVLDTLMQRGASKNQTTALGVTALTLACAGGHADVVRRLIRISNETPRSKQSLAPTPLIVATCSKSPQICSYLADFRVNLDESMKNLGNLTALSMAIVCTPGVYMVRTLIDLGASVNKKGLGDKTAEELAIMLNRKDLIHFFNEKKSYRSRMNADSDVRKEIKNDHIIERELGAPAQNGVSPLMYATTVRSINSAKHLVLHRDSDVNMRDNLHITSLQIASLLRVDDIIPLLLQRRADVTVVNKYGSTAYDLFLLSCEPGQLRGQLHCHRPIDSKSNLNSSSSNIYKALRSQGILTKVGSQIGINSAKIELIEPKHWLAAKTKYQPAKLRNNYKFASVEDILKSCKVAKRPETNECDNETEAIREYMEECQSFAVFCFSDFYGERENNKATIPDYYDKAQDNAKRYAYLRMDGLDKKNSGRQENVSKLIPVRPRKDSIEREYRKPRNIALVDSPSQSQMRTTPRMLKKRDTDYFSAQAGRARASSTSLQVPTVTVTRQRHVTSPVIEDMIWNHFVRRGKNELMRVLQAAEIDKHSFFSLQQKDLEAMNSYTPENMKLIEDIQTAILSRSL